MQKFLVTAEGQHAGEIVFASDARTAAALVFGFEIQTYYVTPSDRSRFARAVSIESGDHLGIAEPIMSAEYDD